MPVTPFHFGPGLLLKAAAPRLVSFSAFATAQIAIDLESGYHLARGEWPVHRQAHSLLLASIIGILAGSAVWFLSKRSRLVPGTHARSEFGVLPAHVGGFLGGLTHPLLDAIMHPDLAPFWPFSSANPLLDSVSLQFLHLACAAAGVAGSLALVLRSRLLANAG